LPADLSTAIFEFAVLQKATEQARDGIWPTLVGTKAVGGRSSHQEGGRTAVARICRPTPLKVVVVKPLRVPLSSMVCCKHVVTFVRTLSALAIAAEIVVLSASAFALTLPEDAVLAGATPEPATPSVRCNATGAPPTPAALAATPTAAAAGSALKLVEDVPLPGSASRFDYQSLDQTTGRLYIAHMDANQLVVFDTKTRKVVGTVDNLPTVTGVLSVPELHRVYAAVAGDHKVAVIDDRSLKIVARLGEISFPDGLDYAPQSQSIFVSDESGGGELVLDAANDKVVTTIDLGGEAGNTHFDAGSGCVYVAVQTRDELVAIDPTDLHVVERFDLGAKCKGPHGFLIDAPRRLAFVTCEDNAKLLVVDLDAMQVTATQNVGDGPDVLALDPGLRRLYVASEAGVVSVFEEQGNELLPIGEYRAPHAHSIEVDPSTHLVYLPLENVGGKPVLRIMTPAD
jgi:DNA-binding beta-propeller fold protein YncE